MHSEFGGSVAERLLHCPGSFKAIQALPPIPDKPSEFAEYGTAMHECMEKILSHYRVGPLPPLAEMDKIAAGMAGQHIYDREITVEHLSESIFPALAAIETVCEAYGGGFGVAGLELRVRFPGIPGAFGTADLLLVSSTHALLIDFKFGKGVGIKSVYTDEDGDRVNPQLLYYLTAARYTYPDMFVGLLHNAVAIIQPRVEHSLTHTEITAEEIDFFTEDMENAVIQALGRSPALCRGDWCRFCPAKPTCPEWVGPIEELAFLSTKPVKRAEPVTKLPTAYATYLGRAKELCDILRVYADDIDDRVHAYLLDGGEVPGWTLHPKKKLRQWADPEIVERHLRQLGFLQDEIWQKKLQTFAVADIAAKKLGVKIPDHLRPTPATDETTVIRDLTRIPVDRLTLLEQLKASVKLIDNGNRQHDYKR